MKFTLSWLREHLETEASLRTGEGCVWHPGTRAHLDYAAALEGRLRAALEDTTRKR